MTPRYDLLPRSKSSHDDNDFEPLRQLPVDELRPLLPHLAEWLEDMNWPVAGPVWRFLLPHAAELEPFIVEVLQDNDDIWKCNLLDLIRYSELPVLSAPLRELAERIACAPTLSERENETAEAACELLVKYTGYLLPRSKFDDAAVARLSLLPESELLPWLPGLAEWIQDWNWPIAPTVGKLLEQHVAALVPTILEVLAGSDSVWQDNLLSLVRPDTLPTLPETLRAVAERIATTPTFGEQADEIDEAARALLNRYATHLLPQHKGDDAAIERLYQVPEAELLPLLPELLPGLLGCLLDGNWPIAKGVSDLLAAHLHQLAPAVWEPKLLEALTGTDNIWKGNLLHLLNQAALPELPPILRQIVERIAHMPTASEREEDTDEAARDLLAKYA